MRDFLRKEDRYSMTFDKRNMVRIGEVDVLFPDLPHEHFILNYEKPRKKQKYKREKVPSDIKFWKKYEIDEYVESMWHRRHHGEWWYINGHPYYIPGPATVFFDFWTVEDGVRPQFRWSALELFQFWYMYIEPNPQAFGLYNLKCRRVGDTENMLFIMWESITRFRHVRGGMQSYTDEEGKRNFERLINAHKRMPFFYKPINTGTTVSYLSFKTPDERITLNKIREANKTEIDPDSFLGSYIDFEATVTGKYDGQKLFRYFLDEIFKIKPHMLDVKKQWNNIRRVTTLNNERSIIGKSILSSTVEKLETKKGATSTLDYAEWLWEDSDPGDLGPDGRTGTGLVRLFRGYEYAAQVDEFGFPRIEEARKFREAKLSKYIASGDYEQVIDLYRKEPASPEEALTGGSEECPLYPEICHMRMRQINEGLDLNNNQIKSYKPPYVEGNLIWKNGKQNTEVVFVPVKGGKWHISQMPRNPNNVQIREVYTRNEVGKLEPTIGFVPMSGPFYRAGGDPYDHQFILGKGSQAALAVKRRMYLPDETAEFEYDDQGMIANVQEMITNRFVCDYVARPKHPEIFYMDIVLTCWFYGTPILLEVDRPGAAIWMRKHGYIGFLQHEPMLINNLRRRSVRPLGVRSSGDLVSFYTDKLQIYVSRYWPCIDHPRLLKNFSRFIPEKRTKYDLTVAAGLAELADTDNTYSLPNEEEKAGWQNSPYQYRSA